MGGREIITLQLGTFANYTGAHFWNIQAGRSPFSSVHLHLLLWTCRSTQNCLQDELLGLDQVQAHDQGFPPEIDHSVLFRAKEEEVGPGPCTFSLSITFNY